MNSKQRKQDKRAKHLIDLGRKSKNIAERARMASAEAFRAREETALTKATLEDTSRELARVREQLQVSVEALNAAQHEMNNLKQAVTSIDDLELDLRAERKRSEDSDTEVKTLLEIANDRWNRIALLEQQVVDANATIEALRADNTKLRDEDRDVAKLRRRKRELQEENNLLHQRIRALESKVNALTSGVVSYKDPRYSAAG